MPITFVLAQADAQGSGYSSLLLLAIMVAFFWLLFIRPQRKRQRQQAEMQSALSVGDQIQSIGGIQGRIVAIEDEMVVIDLESGRMRLAKRAISARIAPETD